MHEGNYRRGRSTQLGVGRDLVHESAEAGIALSLTQIDRCSDWW